MVVIVAELLVNHYLKYPALEKQLSANVLATTEKVADDSSTAPELKEQITFALLQEAGFADMVLQKTPFNGIVFGALDLRDFKSVPVVSYNLLANNRETQAVIYEFQAGSRMLAAEVYGLLKEKAGSNSNLAVNETNQFGGNSFYINFLEQNEATAGKAFLVVKANDYVYALTYLREYHPLIKQLITLLT